jgi:hypothetical protein
MPTPDHRGLYLRAPLFVEFLITKTTTKQAHARRFERVVTSVCVFKGGGWRGGWCWVAGWVWPPCVTASRGWVGD